MLQFELTVLIVACILGIMDTNNRIVNILKNIGIMICLVLFIIFFQRGELMPIITAVIMIFFGNIISSSIRDGEWDVILKSLPFIVGMLYLNRGIITRVYDSAGQFSFVERYNMNYQLKYDGYFGDEVRLYIVTQNIYGNMKKENKVKEKIRKKSDYYVISMNYDQEGNYLATGYMYDICYTHDEKANNPKLVAKMISKKIKSDGMSGIVSYITECVEDSLYGHYGELADEYDRDYEDEPYSDDPDVHWVDGYDRQDGTHVDGYLRTDPDGDPTNNFSYSN